ncbi:helix-turn-helix domain-containing protein [Bremerella volcania]|uniref:helix-turn-helix domain-containing protein n=1 Tax=Bremerella volcania TaxID=2527984 RepID=UPI0037047E91
MSHKYWERNVPGQQHSKSKNDAATISLALRPIEAARSLGISPRYLSQLKQEGKIPFAVIGDGKRPIIVYPVEALREWLSQQTKSVHSDPQ